MRKSTKLAAGFVALALAGCAHKPTVMTPVEVAVPVAKPCPVPTLDTPVRPDLPIRNITAGSPMDKDVDLWKATTLRLLEYIAGLENAVTTRDRVIKVCSGV